METYTTNCGLLLEQDGEETTYTKDGGGTFTVNGEYYSGEAWINEAHYYYTRDEEAGTVVLLDDDNNVCYTFEDSEDGWDEFANSVT